MNSVLNSTYGFLIDDDFINYIMNPTLLLTQSWNEFFEQNPALIPIADEAKSILLGQKILIELSEPGLVSVKNNILNIISNS